MAKLSIYELLVCDIGHTGPDYPYPSPPGMRGRRADMTKVSLLKCY